jgi:hypothetical protein
LVNTLEKMKKYPSKAQSMQILETFRNYIRPVDKQFARELGKYADKFLSAQAVNGYQPYQVEYGVEPVSPMAPFMEESDEADEPVAPEHHCPGNDKCLHEGRCHYPDCNSLSKTKDYTTAYHIPPIHYARQWAELAVAANTKPEITGSNSAIEEVAEWIPGCEPQPEATGSNFAIAEVEEWIPGCERKSEVTGSNSAINQVEEWIPGCEPQPEVTGNISATTSPHVTSENRGFPRAA